MRKNVTRRGKTNRRLNKYGLSKGPESEKDNLRSHAIDIASHDSTDPVSDRSDQLQDGIMTTGEHLDELRRILIRIVVAALGFACLAFACKDVLFRIVFSPSRSDFILFRWINEVVDRFGLTSMHLDDFQVRLINTELAAQLMTHIEISLYIGLLLASPYIVYQLFHFIQPALYEQERRYSVWIVSAVYLLFGAGLLMNYYVIFPISFRFLGTYQVSSDVVNTIILSSYISSFTLLSLMMGLIFEIPVLAFVLGKTKLIDADTLRHRRKVAFIVIMVVSAIITPPDVFTLVLMTLPLYTLYEVSILILSRMHKGQNGSS